MNRFDYCVSFGSRKCYCKRISPMRATIDHLHRLCYVWSFWFGSFMKYLFCSILFFPVLCRLQRNSSNSQRNKNERNKYELQLSSKLLYVKTEKKWEKTFPSKQKCVRHVNAVKFPRLPMSIRKRNSRPLNVYFTLWTTLITSNIVTSVFLKSCY